MFWGQWLFWMHISQSRALSWLSLQDKPLGSPGIIFVFQASIFVLFLIWEKNPERVNITVYDRSKFAYLSLGSSNPWKKGKMHKGEQTGWPWTHKASREQHFTGDFSGHSFVRCGWTALPTHNNILCSRVSGQTEKLWKNIFLQK